MKLNRYHLTVGTLLMALGLTASPVSAQITITADDYRALLSGQQTTVSHYTLSGEGLDAIVAATGENQTWDFSGITYTEIDTSYSETVEPPVPGSPVPGASA